MDLEKVKEFITLAKDEGVVGKNRGYFGWVCNKKGCVDGGGKPTVNNAQKMQCRICKRAPNRGCDLVGKDAGKWMPWEQRQREGLDKVPRDGAGNVAASSAAQGGRQEG